MRKDDTPVTAADIADALAQKAANILPDYALYQNDLPRGFARPSVFVELIRATSAPYSADATEENAVLTVTVFPPRDEFAASDRTAMRQTVGRLIRGLSAGILPVMGRFVRIRSVSAAPDLDRTFVDVAITWYEAREKAKETEDLMQEIHMDIRKE